jgi:hypothetical protein
MTFTDTISTSYTYVYICTSHVYKLACLHCRTIKLLPLFCTVLPHPMIIDGHGSHVTLDFIEYCYQNKIMLTILPLHLAHTLQPLDVVMW